MKNYLSYEKRRQRSSNIFIWTCGWLDCLCYYNILKCRVMFNTDIDTKIFKLHQEGLSVSEIHKTINKYGVTEKVIARSIANSELTIVKEQEGKDSFFIIASIMNYEFRL